MPRKKSAPPPEVPTPPPDVEDPVIGKMARKLVEATGDLDDPPAMVVRVTQMAQAAGFSQGLDPSFKDPRINELIHTLAEIKPRDSFERMLAGQMIACHQASMECFRRAMLDGQTFEGRNLNLKHAEKLSTTYAKLLETLNKHRGQGQQKVTVEHVHVAAGGQAIVGNVGSGAAAHTPARRRKVAPPQLEHHVAPPNPLNTLKQVPVTGRKGKHSNDG